MPRRAPKKYNVTITYCEHTPEEEARISEQVREAIYQAKMIAIKKREEAAAKEAVAKAAQCVVPMPEHFHMEIDFVKHHVAYSKSFYPGATLKDDKFVCFDSDDWYEVLRFCHFVLSDG